MANMSYCRFQNTKLDMQDCQEHLTDVLTCPDEFEARSVMIQICYEMIEAWEHEDMDEVEFVTP